MESSKNEINDMGNQQKKRAAQLDHPSSQASNKRQKHETAVAAEVMDTHTFSPTSPNEPSTVDPVLLEHAKKRLSKFGARLFDPNRIKGLVEPPQIIPLNDEFLTAFGKREKEFDKSMGREQEYGEEITSDDDDDDENENIETPTGNGDKKQPASAKKRRNDIFNRKVKINNLAYRTSEETLAQACSQFGSLQEIKLLLDKEQPAGSSIHNSGRAYVTFETEEGAMACMDGLKKLDGRDLKITIAASMPRPTKGDSGAPSAASLLNQAMERDISTVCFRCGGVGHMEASCPNPMKPRPCSLCGMTDHEQRTCPKNRICFNCGAPGHVNRECTMRRGLPRRMVCGTCFQSGHHRLQCRLRTKHDLPPSVLASAICMTCGQTGHFMCKELKWFFSLRGISCFNCGSQGHSGYDCQRPALYQCVQDPETAAREIERAEANSIAEELEKQQQERGRSKQRGGNHGRGNGGDNKSKSKSVPPNARGNGGSGTDSNERKSFGGHVGGRGGGGRGNGGGRGRRDRRGY
jgi:hypothetical protein